MRGPHTALLLILVAEVAVFGLLGTNFLTPQNAAEIARLSVEVGLLAVALTPVIVTGGIDLSVGALAGSLNRGTRHPIEAAAADRHTRYAVAFRRTCRGAPRWHRDVHPRRATIEPVSRRAFRRLSGDPRR